ncbi:hypothetical protein C8F01DRAFT_1260128 [Mycena amicta]|nr:hypothetical protein C8F01DRAFT_1260128 [Mycena amicta]
MPLCLQDLAFLVDLRVAEMQLPPLDQTEEQELVRTIRMSLTSEEESLRMAPGDSPAESRSPKTSAIIGTKSFPMDEPTFDAYLRSAIQWWTGRRKARGVAERQTSRGGVCAPCEYFNNCEWREQKAVEKLADDRRAKG